MRLCPWAIMNGMLNAGGGRHKRPNRMLKKKKKKLSEKEIMHLHIFVNHSKSESAT